MSPGQVERVKLSATFLSNLGLAIVLAGLIAPLAAFSFRSGAQPPLDAITLAMSLTRFLTGSGIHFVARHLLKAIDR